MGVELLIMVWWPVLLALSIWAHLNTTATLVALWQGGQFSSTTKWFISQVSFIIVLTTWIVVFAL